MAVRNINAIVLRVATQHIAEGLFARPHSRRMFTYQFPALMEEAGTTAVGVIHWTTEIVSRYSSVCSVIAKTGERRVPACYRIIFQILPARIGFPGGIAQKRRSDNNAQKDATGEQHPAATHTVQAEQ